MASRYKDWTFKQVKSIDELERGDIIQHLNGNSWVVDTIDGDTAIAVDTIWVTNPSEWMVLCPPPKEEGT